MNSEQENYFSLTETLLCFFEENSLIYFNNIYYDSKETKDYLMEKESMDIFKECIKFLQDLIDRNNKYDRKNKYVIKLFCIGYKNILLYIYKNVW